MKQVRNEVSRGVAAVVLCVFAFALAVRADARNFVWNPAVAAGNWNERANWLYEGNDPAVTCPSDASQDVVTFNSEATVTLASSAAASNVIFNAAVTLTSTPEERCLLTAANVSGSGAVTLANSGFASPNNIDHTNSVAIVMTPGTTNVLRGVGTFMYKGNLAIKGNISGAGCYFVELSDVQGSRVAFSGNNNAFVGDMYTSGGSSGNVYWDAADSGGSNTFVHIRHEVNTEPMSKENVMFGGYDGRWYSTVTNAGITVGYLNRDSNVTITRASGSGKYNASVTKVGSAGLALGNKNIYNLTINGGTVTAKLETSFNKLEIADGAKLLFEADSSWIVGSEYTLFSYSIYSDVGKAAREVAVIGLEGGRAAVVCKSAASSVINAKLFAFADESAEAVVMRDAEDNYTIKIGGETAKLNVPEGLTVDKVTVAPVTRTVTGLPDGAKLRLAASWLDPATGEMRSEEYDIVQVDATTGAVTLRPDVAVEVGREPILVRPQIAPADGVSKGFEVRNDGVAIGAKTIPGLVYRLVRATELSALDASDPAAAVDSVVASGPRTALADPNLPENVAFYVITVDTH